MSAIPAYLTTRQIAEACEYRRETDHHWDQVNRKWIRGDIRLVLDTQRARRELDAFGILERRRGAWVVSESRLRARAPDIYDRVFSFFALRVSEGEA